MDLCCDLPALGLPSFAHPTRPRVRPLDTLESWPKELGSKPPWLPKITRHQTSAFAGPWLAVLPTITPPRGLSTDSHDGMHDGVGDHLRTDKELSIMCEHGWVGRDEIRCLRLRQQRRGSLPAALTVEWNAQGSTGTFNTCCCQARISPPAAMPFFLRSTQCTPTAALRQHLASCSHSIVQHGGWDDGRLAASLAVAGTGCRWLAWHGIVRVKLVPRIPTPFAVSKSSKTARLARLSQIYP